MVTQLIIVINLLVLIFPLHEDGLLKNSFKPAILACQDNISILVDSKISKADTLPEMECLEVASVILKVVEEMPQFPGGEMEMMKFITELIEYPEHARENNIQGVVPVQFLVETDGSLKYLKAIRRSGYGTEQEALRIIQLMVDRYKWIPGKQRNRTVRVRMTIPVRFALSKDFQEP